MWPVNKTLVGLGPRGQDRFVMLPSSGPLISWTEGSTQATGCTRDGGILIYYIYVTQMCRRLHDTFIVTSSLAATSLATEKYFPPANNPPIRKDATMEVRRYFFRATWNYFFVFPRLRSSVLIILAVVEELKLSDASASTGFWLITFALRKYTQNGDARSGDRSLWRCKC